MVVVVYIYNQTKPCTCMWGSLSHIIVIQCILSVVCTGCCTANRFSVVLVTSLQNGENSSGSECFFLRTTSARIKIRGKPDNCFSSVQRISASDKDPVVLFRSLPRPNDVTTQALNYYRFTGYRLPVWTTDPKSAVARGHCASVKDCTHQ